MLLGLVFIGLFSVMLGMLLFVKWTRSRAVWFILIAFGLVLMVAGMTIPFSV